MVKSTILPPRSRPSYSCSSVGVAPIIARCAGKKVTKVSIRNAGAGRRGPTSARPIQLRFRGIIFGCTSIRGGKFFTSGTVGTSQNELLSSYPTDKMSFFLAKPSKRFDSWSQILSKKSWENYPKILTFSSILLPEENIQHTCKWDTGFFVVIRCSLLLLREANPPWFSCCVLPFSLFSLFLLLCMCHFVGASPLCLWKNGTVGFAKKGYHTILNSYVAKTRCEVSFR